MFMEIIEVAGKVKQKSRDEAEIERDVRISGLPVISPTSLVCRGQRLCTIVDTILHQ